MPTSVNFQFESRKQARKVLAILIRYVNESRYKSRTVIVVADSAQAKEEASPSPSRAAPVHYTIVGIEYQKQITRALGRNEKTCEEKEDQEKKRNKKVTFFCKLEKKSAAAACRRGQIKTRDAATPSPGDDYPDPKLVATTSAAQVADPPPRPPSFGACGRLPAKNHKFPTTRKALRRG
ncbi:hypothetical protein CpipJ_CPIJ000752 [Culex quinquefasciatus]|uniref:Uncharacterized protein n=1 Tax=Culex quinquefasciatus TaxID=7176 RepID=B0W1H4_CULQU|nr:hypothetical protein CpipJ_CPIJ000752 [Culex quinquefasciatus]|eukprot:XP_001842558.1 hypothetical protein CpipJ_CPIJ000752 [Culex quinquefasciatus]